MTESSVENRSGFLKLMNEKDHNVAGTFVIVGKQTLQLPFEHLHLCKDGYEEVVVELADDTEMEFVEMVESDLESFHSEDFKI